MKNNKIIKSILIIFIIGLMYYISSTKPKTFFIYNSIIIENNSIKKIEANVIENDVDNIIKNNKIIKVNLSERNIIKKSCDNISGGCSITYNNLDKYIFPPSQIENFYFLTGSKLKETKK